MGTHNDWMSVFVSTSVKYQTNNIASEWMNEWMNEEEQEQEEVWKKDK